MIAALLLSVLAQSQLRDLGYSGETQAEAQAEAQTDLALIDRRPVSAGMRFEFIPREAEVGEQIELVLTASHALDERIEVDAAGLTEDLAWVVLDEPTRSTTTEGDQATTRIAWKLARLEPGKTPLPEMRVDAVKDVERRALLVAADELDVRGVLGEEEDTPREPIGFREVNPEIAERAWWPWAIAGAVALLLVGAFVGRWLALRRRPRAVPQPTTLERLTALGQTNLDEPASVRELHFELARTLRQHFDGAQNAHRAALTDEEWLRSVATGLTPERLGELGELLETAELVKYGAVQPTQWAVRETLERARAVASAAIVTAPAGAAA